MAIYYSNINNKIRFNIDIQTIAVDEQRLINNVTILKM